MFAGRSARAVRISDRAAHASRITPCCAAWPRRRPARAGLELVAADALQPPFADGAFDTVVTPWFIDIIGEPFARVAARINLLLKPGGRWINSGSLAFSRAAHADRIGLEEALEMLPRRRVRATAACARHAAVHALAGQPAFAARERRDLGGEQGRARPRKRRARALLPDWLLQADRPVPRTRAFEMQAISSRVHAFLLALINGERSMRDMARMLVEQRLMSADEAEAQVRLFLTRLHEDSDRTAIMGTFLIPSKWGRCLNSDAHHRDVTWVACAFHRTALTEGSRSATGPSPMLRHVPIC